MSDRLSLPPVQYCAECGKEIRHGAHGLCLACFLAPPNEPEGR